MPQITLDPRTSRTTTAPVGSGSTREPEVAFRNLVTRLCRQSVDRHFDAFADVEWYRELSPERQAQIGLHRLAVMMRTGWEFENLLQRGLLTRAFRLPNGRPEFRYLHHEVIEESQHTMMFQELVNRTGLPIRGMSRPLRLAAEGLVLPLARVFPELFFLFVLGGEDPIDHVQRQRLRHGVSHPLAERIMRIHVTEEARHLSFARHFLKTSVPKMGRTRRLILTLAAPVLLGIMAETMLAPSATFAADTGVPRRVVRQAARSEASRVRSRDAVTKVRRLWRELGLLTPVSTSLWRAFHLWDDDTGDGAEARGPEAPADAPSAPTT